MKRDPCDCNESLAKADQSQWLRFFKRHVLRRRYVLSFLLTLLRLVAELRD